jgi:phi LC3 family holin
VLNKGDKLAKVVEVAFTLLAILGVVVDPTTKGMSDSTQAMDYDKPKGE